MQPAANSSCGRVPLTLAERIAYAITHQHDDTFDHAHMAAQFGLTEAQLHHSLRHELTTTLAGLRRQRWLALARQLVMETDVPLTAIATAGGFAGLPGFTGAFTRQHGESPYRLRGSITQTPDPDAPHGTATLRLAYRPPYDWDGLLLFLQAKTLLGAEWVAAGCYHRTVRLGTCTGWVRVGHDVARRALRVTFTLSLLPVLAAVLSGIRNLCDLMAEPRVINTCLRRDPALRPLIAANPGLRMPGAFDGFELALRAILGQQVTVRAATTLAGRLVAAFGEPITTPLPALTHLSPTPLQLARASVDRIASLGIIQARAKCIIALAQACADGRLRLDMAADPVTTMAQLLALPGIGQWTAHYIAMRALRWGDAFPKEDIAIRNNLGGLTAREAEARSQAWRPWRSYAVMHIWRIGWPPKNSGKTA